MKIAIAGATGFIGQNLIAELLNNSNHHIVMLSRNAGKSNSERIEVRPCDLYSLLEAEWALEGCDTAIYLVHSMAPRTSRLSQGNFRDFDFLLADNFARAAKNKGIKHIIYVSGIVPNDERLSKHLSSRLEVENTIAYRGVPLTTLRCGLVIGAQGSSYEILERLVDRLPIMILPKWMETRTQVVFVEDLAKIMVECIDLGPSIEGSFDVGGPDVLSYKNLLIEVTRLKNSAIKALHVPNIPLMLSKLWVRLITGIPKNLVYPLIDSLKHEMICAKERMLPNTIRTTYTPLLEALKKIQQHRVRPKIPVVFEREKVEMRTEVQSIQRLTLPVKWSSQDVATAYIQWLPHYLRTWIYAKNEDNNIYMYLTFLKKPLLVLSLNTERSSIERQLFYITAGILADTSIKGRLEFREGTDKTFIIAAIHRFRPTLPWLIYRLTQAQIHLWVMYQFQRYLAYKDKKQAAPPPPLTQMRFLR